MRGKRVLLSLARGTPDVDSLGRVTTSLATFATVRGSISPPDRSPEAATANEDIDAVACAPASAILGHLDPLPVIQVSGYGVLDGAYTITRVSGGRRIVRLGLTRVDRRDATHGRL